MNATIEGRAWVFGDSMDTDNMYPGFAMKLSTEEAAQHVFYDVRPGWAEQVQPGDIVIGGRNFGIGSSRPVAQLFQHLGVAAIVAEEFNSLFFRNAINFGLPAVTIPGAGKAVPDGEQVRLELRMARLEWGQGQTLDGPPMPDFVFEIVSRGGLWPKLVADGYIEG